jgi:hypothetical protein
MRLSAFKRIEESTTEREREKRKREARKIPLSLKERKERVRCKSFRSK